MMIYINMAVIVLLILQDFVLWILTHSNFKIYHQRDSKSKLPQVSVLVPARNEEIDLPFCLKSLSQLDYPTDRIEFIIGNDQSTDNTPGIVKDWVLQGKNRVMVEVSPADPRKINGKANALSQMVKVACGEYYFFTDADCEVPPLWIREMLKAYHSENGVITGITAVRPNSFFAAMQGMDWWITLGMVKIMADLQRPMTAMGNNMMISKEAYWTVGGFEGIPFSVTEDFTIAQALMKKGFHPIHQVIPQTLIWTKSERNIEGLLKQRKRWMNGALSLPWYWFVLLTLQFGFFPALIMVLQNNLFWGLCLWATKLIFQSLFIRDFAARTGTKVPLLYLLCFELYYLIVSWSTILYYFWPSAVNWKERKYS
jgi:cellulose synthase/poly-beta-1,6-N-acetylglucosamine synthase-like glycosyltransferase